MTADRNRRWYCRNLGDAMLAAPLLEELCDAFERARSEDTGTAALGLFVRHESAGQLHCDLKVYFPPAAEAIAKKLGATPCPEPGKYGLSLLVGDESAESDP